jgi:hypothetical protein
MNESITNRTVLKGRWRRPDGGYIIEIDQVSADGTLGANYFNPRPITVTTARWRLVGDSLQLRLDLNASGYEGAYYLLQFDAKSEQLRGEYHPANQEIYQVRFDRIPASS